MGTLAVERGVSTFGQQMGFAREFEQVLAAARATGTAADPAVAERLLDSWMDLQVLWHTAIMSRGGAGTGANVAKLMWSRWHQRLGELAVDVLGADATVAAGPDPADLTRAQQLHLFTRADTIYGGSNEIQRTVIAQRLLGLPRGPG
jgi:alkylation response protein AidB-like acyl-CoA dehydrogenase